MSAAGSLIGATILAVVAAVITILALKGKYGMIAIGILIRICLIVGAIRLAKPTSVWARTFYDREQLTESIRRFPLTAGEVEAATPRTPRPPAAATEVLFLVVVMLAAACTLVVQPVTGLMFGVALPMVWFALAGLRWARLTVVSLTGAAVLVATVFSVLATVNGSGGALLIAVLGDLLWVGAFAWDRWARPSELGPDLVPAGDDPWPPSGLPSG